jgi:hypothetical protein
MYTKGKMQFHIIIVWILTQSVVEYVGMVHMVVQVPTSKLEETILSMVFIYALKSELDYVIMQKDSQDLFKLIGFGFLLDLTLDTSPS